MRRPAENLPQARLECAQWFRRITRIERALIPVGAEILAGLVPRGAAKFLAGISLPVIVMGIVVGLEQAVLLDDPRDFWTHIGPNDCRRYFRVVVRRQL